MAQYLDENGLQEALSKVNDKISGRLSTSGGTVSGDLTVGNDITANRYLNATWLHTTKTGDLDAGAAYEPACIDAGGWLYKVPLSRLQNDLGVNGKQPLLNFISRDGQSAAHDMAANEVYRFTVPVTASAGYAPMGVMKVSCNQDNTSSNCSLVTWNLDWTQATGTATLYAVYKNTSGKKLSGVVAKTQVTFFKNA